MWFLPRRKGWREMTSVEKIYRGFLKFIMVVTLADCGFSLLKEVMRHPQALTAWWGCAVLIVGSLHWAEQYSERK
jgi:hypothetical protein